MKIVTMLIAKNKLLKSKILKYGVAILFLLYVLLFFTLTLFNRGEFISFKWNEDEYLNYINTSFNIIPFKTIRAYFKAFFKGNISTYLFLYNIFGNFFALMPFAIGLTMIFEKQNNFLIFLGTISILVLGIELLQFISFAGSSDPHDYILNFFCYCLMFFILLINIL